jgi:hypothetical protein
MVASGDNLVTVAVAGAVVGASVVVGVDETEDMSLIMEEPASRAD